MISEHTRNPGKRNRTGKARPCHPFLKKTACSKAGGCAAIRFIPTLQQDPFLKQFCLEDMYSCSSDYLWYPYYPEYHDYCYQNVISCDNTGLSPADNIYWLGCIIASEGRNLNNRFDPNERLNWDLSLQTGILRYAKPRRRLFRKRLKQQ